MLDLHVGGEAGRHPAAVIAPLLIHDLPVTVWWPGEIPFGRPMAEEILELTDRLVVDGSSWSGDGLPQLARMAGILGRGELAVSDFALDRQARWREAIASAFDMPELLPYLRSIRRIVVTYSTHDPSGAPGSTNLVKPVYHAAWLASRLGLRVVTPLSVRVDGGSAGVLRGHHAVDVAIVPERSPTPGGTTLRVELRCERRGSGLDVDVTAEAETVRVQVRRDGDEMLDRRFRAARRTDVELLMEALEESGRDPVTSGTLRAAAALVGQPAA
jgi:glucose-6-phosphate dehydrogenase assembly protein OpcA